jgi:hypothetical protein
MIPARDILFGERDISAIWATLRIHSRTQIQQQRQKPFGFRIRRGLSHNALRQPDRLLCPLPAFPTDPIAGERRVDCVQQSRQSARKTVRLGLFEFDAKFPDPRLGSHKSLRHGRVRNQIRRPDLACREPQENLKHQGRAHRRVDPRIGAGQHQRQPPVRKGCP